MTPRGLLTHAWLRYAHPRVAEAHAVGRAPSLALADTDPKRGARNCRPDGRALLPQKPVAARLWLCYSLSLPTKRAPRCRS